eukprot:scaffold3408_cov129-Amphora_coffeaeformis.AAC.15
MHRDTFYACMGQSRKMTVALTLNVLHLIISPMDKLGFCYNTTTLRSEYSQHRPYSEHIGLHSRSSSPAPAMKVSAGGIFSRCKCAKCWFHPPVSKSTWYAQPLRSVKMPVEPRGDWSPLRRNKRRWLSSKVEHGLSFVP